MAIEAATGPGRVQSGAPTFMPCENLPEGDYVDRDASLVQVCRSSLFAAGEPLLKRAQEAGEARPDIEFSEILQMVMGITKIPSTRPDQIERLIRIALDGLRYSALVLGHPA